MQDVISKYLTDNVKITKLQDHTTAGTGTITSDELDMAGYSNVLFITSFGTANAGNIATMHQSVASGGEASSLALKTSGSSDEDIFLDVEWNPTYRYAKLVITRGASTTCESIWAIQYNARTKSINNATSGTSAVGQFSAPALG